MEKIKLSELQTLDLSKCKTIGQLVGAMEKCSFGARMLGEMAENLEKTIKFGVQPLVIFDGKTDSALFGLLEKMVKKKWFKKIITTESYAKDGNSRGEILLVIGQYSELYAEKMYEKAGNIFYINNQGQTKPNQFIDGYYPRVVFSDPNFIVPVIFHVLQERLEGKKLEINDFFADLEKYPGLSIDVAKGGKTLAAASNDPECKVFMTLSGAMTIAKMGWLICDMIDSGMIQYISSTGALMAHGLIEGVGLKHYKYNPSHNDQWLRDKRLNRVTDTIEPEENFDHIDDILGKIFDFFDGSRAIGSIELHREIGRYLSENFPGEKGILKSAYEKNVPVSVPAFVDSEVANDLYTHNLERKKNGKLPLVINSELDTEELVKAAVSAKRRGIFTVGGGVPRNNTQNVAPLVNLINNRSDEKLPEVPFFYACRMDPAPMFYGNLGGCTYSEGMSWGKMDPKGMFAEIRADATIVWPFILKYALENQSIEKNLKLRMPAKILTNSKK